LFSTDLGWESNFVLIPLFILTDLKIEERRDARTRGGFAPASVFRGRGAIGVFGERRDFWGEARSSVGGAIGCLGEGSIGCFEEGSIGVGGRDRMF